MVFTCFIDKLKANPPPAQYIQGLKDNEDEGLRLLFSSE